MQIEISKNEAWKILDAIKAYQKDYALTGPVDKLLSNMVKKLKSVTEEKTPSSH
jgi:hypothetical protein